MTVIEWLGYAKKAVVALTAALGQLGIALAPASDSGSDITGTEWVMIAVAFVTALGVYTVTNTPKPDLDE